MLQRQKFVSALAVLAIVIGLSGGLSFASDTTAKVELNKMPVVLPLNASQQTSPVAVSFTITDASVDGSHLTLRGHSRKDNAPVSVTIPIAVTHNITSSKAPVHRVFDRDDGH